MSWRCVWRGLGVPLSCRDTIISIIKDKETEFFKNILIDIDDTPEWMQPILKEIKSEQLKKKEETNNIKEKPLTLGKRILNWFTK